uniref:Uncharacterized protein n=1 Tax=Ascaris lumbricoides TaxID=6252 RepID=A0A0M3I983_ASCLU
MIGSCICPCRGTSGERVCGRVTGSFLPEINSSINLITYDIAFLSPSLRLSRAVFYVLTAPSARARFASFSHKDCIMNLWF